MIGRFLAMVVISNWMLPLDSQSSEIIETSSWSKEKLNSSWPVRMISGRVPVGQLKVIVCLAKA